MKTINLLSLFILFQLSLNLAEAQTVSLASSSDYITPQGIPDESLWFNIADSCVYKPIIWGLVMVISTISGFIIMHSQPAE